MGVTVHQEVMSEVLYEIKEASVRHRNEVDLKKDNIPLDPNWDMYKILEDNDALLWMSARNDDFEMVGYLCFMIHPHMHYKDHLTAAEDVIWVDKDYRRAGVANALVVEAEKILEDRGVRIIQMSTKVHLDFDGFFQSLGYTPVETLYSKVID